MNENNNEKKDNVLLWFKNDLRIHDNESLTKAMASGSNIIAVYCFDTRLYQKLKLGFNKADLNRFEFLKQSVIALQNQLRVLDGDLLIVKGIPEEEIPKIVKHHCCQEIFAEMEYAPEELDIINKIKESIHPVCQINLFWGKTLYHIDDIPYSIAEIPMTSKAYRINTSKKTQVRATFPTPTNLSMIKIFSENYVPNITNFGFEKNLVGTPYMNGGEIVALKRLEHYTFETELLTSYRWTRNRSLGLDYSSKFSPFLALGCISPRTIYEKVKEYEKGVKKNQSTWWIIFELVWRDFFTFKGMRMGSDIFKTKGFKSKDVNWENDKLLFSRWCDGRTGIPFVDAHMRQLNETGFMSNRGRVNCASFLIHDYKIDWTWGAAYFESKLIDYDVSANWMNWHYQAFETWYTNPVNQGIKYKAKEFIQKNIPELKLINNDSIYAPWEYEIKSYPTPDEVYGKWQRAINKIKKSVEDERSDQKDATLF